MVPSSQIESFEGEEHKQSLVPAIEPEVANVAEVQSLREIARKLAGTLSWLPERPPSDDLARRCQALVATFKSVFENVDAAFAKNPGLEDLLWLRTNAQPLFSAARLVTSELAPLTNLPVVATKSEILPRVWAIARGFLEETNSDVSKAEFTAFCLAFEEKTPLEFHEIGALVPALKLVLLEQIAHLASRFLQDPKNPPSQRVVPHIRTFQHVTQSSWKEELESLIPFDRFLREDPAGAYAGMDLESRNVYRESVAKISERSDRTEMEVAQEALALARKALARKYDDPRIKLRESHIGYYLVAEGKEILCQRVGYHRSFRDRFQRGLRTHPDEFLLLGTAVLTFAIIVGVVWLLTPATTPPEFILLSLLFLLLPSSQAAVQIMNYLTTNLLPADTLPKLDFSDAVPEDCVTLVAVPTLLLNEKQVHHLIENLEVRYLGNHDRNIHFALVSDLPDAHQPAPEDSAMVALCSSLIAELNERYSGKNDGHFFHLHRHRVYNPRERGWMGWERKRGKLLDLNQFLRGQYDSFPVKVGDLSILPKVRYVLTLDSDTELPRGSAHKMVGAIAHPLNQAIVDPVNNIVVAGYGILQPRVGISVQCTARSRLAAIFAGETGLDPYTRAISDVYQDLYGEGTFTGKGIYEVETLFRVLHGRFPQNALLSHDLIEGAYARAGLVTDIVVIEDYPSHYSAYNRRKHRWLRGDWQIIEWLTDEVPTESGARVRNPISLVSRWKIFDNLRRSLIEPATFALLLFGWLATGHPLLWTLGAICILFAPAWFEFGFALCRAVVNLEPRIVRDALDNLVSANLSVLLTLTLLAHQMLLSLDAVIRALVRHLVTRERMLEWETAAEAELGERRNTVDRYMEWMPLLAIGLGFVIWLIRPHALLTALPILVLWAGSKQLTVWLNSSPIEPPPEITSEDSRLLRKSALYIWRYFAEFSNQDDNWLVPDNVQADMHDKSLKVAASVSPTNLGLLLNARQAAAEFGYITVPEMVELTQKTLDTLNRLPKYRGHLLNWYETRTLEPKPPFFVSSVDSGNLVASLWTLQQGAVDRLRRPVIPRALAKGMLDYLRALVDLGVLRKRAAGHFAPELKRKDWLHVALKVADDVLSERNLRTNVQVSPDAEWFLGQARGRAEKIRDLVQSYAPWMLPEFAELRQKLDAVPIERVPLRQLPDLISTIESRLQDMLRAAHDGDGAVGERLQRMVSEARQNTLNLTNSLRQVRSAAHELASAMDFTFLLDEQRQLLSVGFDAQTEVLAPYCYDLLATEPRTAVFVGIAKEDIPQDVWFQLDRPFTRDDGRIVLLSWTGTMFEYLMPSIWMRSYPNTLLDRASIAAVRSQQAYGMRKRVPWGISESACAVRNEAGDYHYEAFGVPQLARKKSESERLVISPYSTFLALSVDPQGALKNLRKMDDLGWFGSYGFYEAADYTSARRRLWGGRPEIVHSWMVHHLGMSLLSLANYLCDDVVRRWFHSDPRVQATAILLQEKPVSRPV